jgi:hypothetical protein
MSERSDRPSEVLGALPHRRPNRRSEKRAGGARAVAPEQPPPGAATGKARGKQPTTRPRAGRREQPSPPAGRREQPSPAAQPSPPRGAELVSTAVQAAAELAEIGLSATARAIREAVARLPRP